MQPEKYLENLLASGRVGQTLLFVGGDPLLFAQKLASTFDIHIYRPEGRGAVHTIAAMRDLQTQVHLNPTNSSHKVFIIEQAERLPPTSANALLKTFEEPPLDTLIILSTTKPHRLLPTIRSRCRTLRFPIPKPTPPPALLDLLQNAPYGHYDHFLEKLSAIEEPTDSDDFFASVLWWFRKRDGLEGLERVEKVVREARDGVLRYGKVGACLEAMCVELELV